MDGHIVQGHVDSTGVIISNNLVDDSWLLKIKINKKWLKYCILKGSIAIDGISLTISNIDEDYDDTNGAISISIIPHTLEHTNLKYKKYDDLVNIETDFFAKYIEKLLPKKEKEMNKVKQAIKDIHNGKMVIVVDHEDRENEGDFVMSAEKATSEDINFMMKYGEGLIAHQLLPKELEVRFKSMVANNTEQHKANIKC